MVTYKSVVEPEEFFHFPHHSKIHSRDDEKYLVSIAEKVIFFQKYIPGIFVACSSMFLLVRYQLGQEVMVFIFRSVRIFSHLES